MKIIRICWEMWMEPKSNEQKKRLHPIMSKHLLCSTRFLCLRLWHTYMYVLNAFAFFCFVIHSTQQNNITEIWLYLMVGRVQPVHVFFVSIAFNLCDRRSDLHGINNYPHFIRCVNRTNILSLCWAYWEWQFGNAN